MGASVVHPRGCSKVGEATVSAVAQSCPLLTYANLNYTATTPAALSRLLSSCPELEVLKIAAIPKLVRFSLAFVSVYLAEMRKDDRRMHSSQLLWI